MALTFKWNNICSLSLSKVCFLLGLLDLALNFTMMVICAINVDGDYKYNSDYMFLLILAIIGICTCLLMMAGSKWNNRSLLLPHMLWTMLRVGLIPLVFGVGVKESLVSVTIFSLIWIPSFLYWNIMFNRFQEIKEERSASSDLVEIR